MLKLKMISPTHLLVATTLLAIFSLACPPLAMAQPAADATDNNPALHQPETTSPAQPAPSPDDPTDEDSANPEDLPEPSTDDYGAKSFKAPDNETLRHAREHQDEPRNEMKYEQGRGETSDQSR